MLTHHVWEGSHGISRHAIRHKLHHLAEVPSSVKPHVGRKCTECCVKAEIAIVHQGPRSVAYAPMFMVIHSLLTNLIMIHIALLLRSIYFDDVISGDPIMDLLTGRLITY